MLGVYVRVKATILHHEHESTDFVSTTHLLCPWKVCVHEQNQSITFMLHNLSLVVKTVRARHQNHSVLMGWMSREDIVS